jgi:hypothetical protein
MQYKAPGNCPVCGEKLSITRLNCSKCATTIEGHFHPCEFCRLPDDDLEFIKIFIKCRGNIKDVEKEMGISYPTVRGKLDNAIKALGFEIPSKESIKENEEKKSARNEILNLLSQGEISAAEATKRINNL